MGQINNPLRWVYAADLGGKNIRMAAVREDGSIGSITKRQTPVGIDIDTLLYISSEMIGAISAEHESDGELCGIGFATPAPSATDEAGTLVKLPNLPGLNGARLGERLREMTGLPIRLENDATAAAIGEHWLGAARDAKDSITITIGTGIGGGIIINGQPFRGVDGTAGEVGHICVERDGRPCGCGSHGCVEQYASVSAIERLAAETGLGSLTGKQLYEAAMSGNPKAIEVFHSMGRSLGVMIATVINMINPEVIVLGGGGSNGWDAFMPVMLDEAKRRAFEQPYNRVKFAKAELGDNAGIFGAARGAFGAV